MAPDSPTRKTVLFVDDDTTFLQILQTYMEGVSGGTWDVITATESTSALKVLNERPVDLAVLDVQMPVVDGIQLLQLINKRHPQLKKAVLSGHVDDDCRRLAFNGGAELVLEKPRNAGGYTSLFTALNEVVHFEAEQGFRGLLQRVGIEDVIQLECLRRRSIILELISTAGRGRIYIRSGSLIHAEYGKLVGEPALQQLLTLSGGEFRNLPYAAPERETLEGSWEFLLMEAVRQRDEARGAELEANQQQSIVPPVPAPARDADEPLINELFVVSDAGEVLYASDSAHAPARAALVKILADGAAKLGELLPLGTLERVEFLNAPGRMLVRVQDGQSIFLRANDYS